jgi:hypothetical protein
MESDTGKKIQRDDKKQLLNVLNNSINPIIRDLQTDTTLVVDQLFSKLLNLHSDVRSFFTPSRNTACITTATVENSLD